MKHRLTLSDEEIELLLNAIESADWYGEDEAFWRRLELLERKLRAALDPDTQERRRAAGRIAWETRVLKEKIRRELLGEG